MIVGVTGASGFIGKKTIKILKDSGHEVKRFVRREVKNDDEIYWSPAKKEIDKDKFQELDAIIHLAGESIAPQDILGFLPFAGGRWSKERKSRIYGDHGDEIVTEETSFNRGQFLQMVAEECWEEPLYEIEKMGVRVMKCRAGIVLGKGNIATQIFTLISKLNLSGPIGDGKQYFSWVSVYDMAEAFVFCLENENIDGAVNVTAPEPLQQKEFSRAIAKIMDKAFFAPPLPPIIMRLAVGWELGEQLGLNSIRAIPQKLLKEGFKFKNPTLKTMKDDFI